ncbi:MAG: IS3 family transposase [Candidatus Pacebacteria bacterium]|nr:IS3 family transposase [Candidatus Paceibacterota bacterium]
MKKFNIENKLKAIEMYKKGASGKEIFKKLFSEIDISKYQENYASKTISAWKRKQNKGSKANRFKKVQEQLKILEIEVAILKKESVLFPLLRKELKLKRSKERKFEIIYEVKKENSNFSLKTLLKFYSVSSSGYYKYTNEKDEREEKDFSLFVQINTIFEKKKGKKGYRQIAMDLYKNHKQVYRIMKKYGLKAKIRKVNPARVTLKKNKENMFVKNILSREFKQKTPYTFASTDITYLKYQKSSIFAFLSVVKDLATGEILSWELSKTMDLKLVLDTIDNLEIYFQKNDLELNKLLLHSDQGFQYTNIKYHQRLKGLTITQSMSRKGNSVDNAPIESFFGHMKDEVGYNKLNFKDLFNLIEEYMLEYNQQRKQWNRKKMTPVCYREYLFEKNFAL